MTFQAREIITYKGERNYMTSLPLDQYLSKRKDVKFVLQNTACWHCYNGEWEINDTMLYLVSLSAKIKDYKEVNLNYLFPNKKVVFADWFSGEIRIQVGEVIEYGNFVVTTEKDVILQLKNGVLISEKEIDNYEEIKKRKIQQLKLQQEAKNIPPKKPTFWQRLFGKKPREDNEW